METRTRNSSQGLRTRLTVHLVATRTVLRVHSTLHSRIRTSTRLGNLNLQLRLLHSVRGNLVLLSSKAER